MNEKKKKKNYNKSNLIYNRFRFYRFYSDDKKFDSLSFKSKYSYLSHFYADWQKLVKMKLTNLVKIKWKEKVYNTVIELYNKRFENCVNEYNELLDVRKDELDQKFKSINLRPNKSFNTKEIIN